jgi:hypothetical protein
MKLVMKSVPWIVSTPCSHSSAKTQSSMSLESSLRNFTREPWDEPYDAEEFIG